MDNDNKPKVPVKNAPDAEVKHLPNTTSGSISSEAMAAMMRELLPEILKHIVPATAIGINQANQMAVAQSREALARELIRKTRRCLCGQPQTACGGVFEQDKDGNDIVIRDEEELQKAWAKNHVKEYVGPKDENLFRWFQGMIVNGVRYLSDFPGHKIWIPKKSDILTQVNMWEQNEKDLLQKRTAWGQGAGSIGQRGEVLHRGSSQFQGWR